MGRREEFILRGPAFLMQELERAEAKLKHLAGDSEDYSVLSPSEMDRFERIEAERNASRGVISRLKEGQTNLNANLQGARAELAKTKRILEIERNSRHKFCPDCRDKVGAESCLRCQLQKAKGRGS